MELLERHIEIVEIYELYRPLLTLKQQNILSYYYLDNYSLGEIAELEDISRNAVHDLLKRTVKKLYDFESKLKLHKKQKIRQKTLKELHKNTEDKKLKKLLEMLEKVEQDGI